MSVLDRYRTADPSPSEQAARVSEKNLRITKVRVLELLLTQGSLSSSEINDQYMFARARLGWTPIAYDSPRKRAGELVDDGYLEVVAERPGVYGTPESVYALTARGRRIATLGGKK